MTKETWAKATARSIGVAELDFTPTRVGQTLHIPCRKGNHVVDVTVQPGLAPAAVAKRMLSAGWVMGNKPTCPDCARKPKKVKSRAKGGHARAEKLSAERRSEIARIAARKRWNAAPKKVEQVEIEPMEMTAAAKKAHRMVMMMLEEQYDEAHKTYRPGWSDERISEECGTSKASVAKTREEFFGPAGIPAEAQKLRDDIGQLRKEFEATKQAFEQRIASLSSRFETAMLRNGW